MEQDHPDELPMNSVTQFLAEFPKLSEIAFYDNPLLGNALAQSMGLQSINDMSEEEVSTAISQMLMMVGVENLEKLHELSMVLGIVLTFGL